MRATLLFVVLFASRPLFAQNDSILNNEFAHDGRYLPKTTVF